MYDLIECNRCLDNYIVLKPILPPIKSDFGSQRLFHSRHSRHMLQCSKWWLVLPSSLVHYRAFPHLLILFRLLSPENFERQSLRMST